MKVRKRSSAPVTFAEEIDPTAGVRVADILTLRVTEYGSPTEWRWELTGLGAEFLADHEVRLTADSEEYRAFCDLHGHLKLKAARDRRLEHEAEILHGLGRWIAESVFGSAVESALMFYAPCTVRVLIPEEARALIAYPLEAAVFGNASLAAVGVGLVLEVETAPTAPFRPPPKEPVRDRLRVLGLFTVPEGSSALNLRRERRELVRQFGSWAAEGAAIDLRILQYGVTRERLKDVIAEAEGWDVVHISGHGARGALLLERSDGTNDLVTNDELIEMLRPAHRRLKLVTVAACHSAARATVDHLSLLGLKPAVRAEEVEEEENGADQPHRCPGSGRADRPVSEDHRSERSPHGGQDRRRPSADPERPDITDAHNAIETSRYVSCRRFLRPAVQTLVAFIDEFRQVFGVEPICRVLSGHGLKIATSTYYAAKSRRPSARAVRDAELKAQISRVHAANYGAYGVRKVWRQLHREGIVVARCTVARLMRELGLQGARRGKKLRTTVREDSHERATDLLKRDFTAARPNQRWVADFTHVATACAPAALTASACAVSTASAGLR